MILKFIERVRLNSLVQNKTLKPIRFGLANKTPFEQNKPTQSPFVTPKRNSNWSFNKTDNTNEVKPTFNTEVKQQRVKQERVKQQRITPLTQSQEQPIVETEIKPIREPPPLSYQSFSEKNLLKKEDSEILSAQAAPAQAPIQSTQKEVMSDLGLNRYLSRVFTTTGISVTISLMAAYAGIFIPNISEIGQAIVLSFSLLSYGCFDKASKMQFTTLSEMRKGEQMVRTKNSLERLAIYGVGCLSLGFSASPLFYSINEISMNILPLTMGVSAAIFGGASLLGLILPRGFMLGYGSVLMGGIIGLIGLNFSGLLAAKFLGMHTFAATLLTIEAYCGIVLFSAMLVYDTHSAIKRYKLGDADHLGMSIQILLDVMNLIIRIAAQIAKHKQKQNKK